MSIDWFTFVAQIVNFLVLVLLLQRFLYGPIVTTMQRREQQIMAQIADADEKAREADRKAREYAATTQVLEAQREQLLRQARRDAHEERERLASDARKDVQRKRDEWMGVLQREQHAMMNELHVQSARLSVAISRKMLRQLAEADLEERMVAHVLTELQLLDDVRRAEIASLLVDGEGTVVVRSAFALSDAWRTRLADEMRELFDCAEPISFETSSELIWGLELDVGGYTFGWNVRDALQELTGDMTAQFRHGDYIESDNRE